MNKRVPYTIIPKYFRTINDIEREQISKQFIGNLGVKRTLHIAAAKFNCWNCRYINIFNLNFA